jgi:predicted Na+-dependent transporter
MILYILTSLSCLPTFVLTADLALSVAMTTVSSILSIGLLPANLFLYTYLAYGVTDDNQDSVVQALDFGALFITLGIVMAAISSGLYAGYVWDYPKFHVYANRFGSVCGILLILCSLFLASGADGAESNFWSQPWAFYVGVAFPCLLGIAVANIIARSVRLSPPETVAISIECCYQNTGIATVSEVLSPVS